MARAQRHFLPGNVWHITHRYHKKEFLLKLVMGLLQIEIPAVLKESYKKWVFGVHHIIGYFFL